MASNMPGSGDPFSRAYSKGGSRKKSAQKPAQKKPAQKSGMGSMNDPYAGYVPGMETCPPLPTQALEECLRSAVDLLEDTLQITDLAPWIHPPYRSTYYCKDARAVVSTTAGVNAVTNASGIALAAANSAFVTLTPLEMESTTKPVTIFRLETPQATAIRVASWGITNLTGPPEQVEIRVRAATTYGTPGPPNPGISGAQVSDHQPTFFIMQGGQDLEVQVRLRDVTQGPALLRFGICYWEYPISKRTDSRDKTRLRSGYGTGC